MSSTADITGPSEVKFVQDYLRPISEATIDYYNNYLTPFINQWNSSAQVIGLTTDTYTFSDSFTGAFAQGIVNDGFSAEHWFKLTGADVHNAASAISTIQSDIAIFESDLIRAAARGAFSTETIDLRQSTQGTGGWVTE
tara:strand:+ start:524 stop:940 length:417 start_codon:yes stop_codon:yes gene_type:complete